LAVSKAEAGVYMIIFTVGVFIVLTPLAIWLFLYMRKVTKGREALRVEAQQMIEAGDLAGAIANYKTILRFGLSLRDGAMIHNPGGNHDNMNEYGWKAVESMEKVYAIAEVPFDRAELTALVKELKAMSFDPKKVDGDGFIRKAFKAETDDIRERFVQCIDGMPELG